MPTSRPLIPWLTGAVAANLVVASLAGGSHVPEVVIFYVVIAAYAVPAAVGLYRAGVLKPWPAVAFAALIVASNDLAVLATFAAMPGYGGMDLWPMMRSGALGGLIGAAGSLFGLVLLGGRPTARRFALAAGFSALLMTMGGGLVGVLLESGFGLAGLSLPLILYLPWQIVFSCAVVMISAPGHMTPSNPRAGPLNLAD